MWSILKRVHAVMKAKERNTTANAYIRFFNFTENLQNIENCEQSFISNLHPKVI